MRKSLCTECFSEFDPESLNGRDLFMTENGYIVDDQKMVVGCKSCLGSFVNCFEGKIKKMKMEGSLLTVELTQGPIAGAVRPTKMLVWPRY